MIKKVILQKQFSGRKLLACSINFADLGNSYNKKKMNSNKQYIENSANQAGDKIKEARNDFFGKPEKDKTFGDKIDEKLQNNEKPIMEKVSDYAKNTSESIGQSFKQAKEKAFGKPEEDKTVGDKFNQKIGKQDQKPMMDKVGNYVHNTVEYASEGLKNAKQGMLGKPEEEKTLGDKTSQKVDEKRQVLGDKIEKTGKDMKKEETMGQKLSNMGKNMYDGAANMASNAAETLGIKENKNSQPSQ